MRALAVLFSTVATAACGSGASPEAPPGPETPASLSEAAPVRAPPADVAEWRPPSPTHLMIQRLTRHADRVAMTRIDLATSKVVNTIDAAHSLEAPLPSTVDGVTWISGDVAGTSHGVLQVGPDGALKRIALPSAPRAVLACGDFALVSTNDALGYVRFGRPEAGFQVLAARALDPHLDPLLLRRGAVAVAIESSDREGTGVTTLRLTEQPPVITAVWPLPARFSPGALAPAGGDDARWLYFVTREDHKDARAHALGRIDLDARGLPPGDWVDDLANHPSAIVESERGTYARHRWRFEAERVLAGKEMTPWSGLAHLPRKGILAIAAGERGVILVREDLAPGAKPIAHIEIRGHEARDVVAVGDRLFALASSAARDQLLELAPVTDGSWQVVRTIALPPFAGRRVGEGRFLR